MLRRFVTKLLFGAVLVHTLAGAALSAERILSVRLANDITTLDWNRGHTNADLLAIHQLMDGLFRIDARSKLVAALCAKHTVSPDGRIYRFWIRKDVRWSDGVPLIADHFISSWKRLVDPRTAAPGAYFLKETEFSAPAPDRIEVRIVRPMAQFIWTFAQAATFPVREDLIAKYGDGWTAPGKLVTLGSFILESTMPGREAVLRRNPQYWRGVTGNIDQVVLRTIREDSTAENLFATGKIDFFPEFGAMVLERHRQDPGLRWLDPLRTYYLGINAQYAPLVLPQVRRAIAQGIDKTSFSKLFQGEQKPATTFVPPGLTGYFRDLGLAFAPAQARKTIEQAGLTVEQQTIELMTLSMDKSQLVAEYIQGEIARNLGLKIQIRVRDSKTFYGLLNAKSAPLFLNSWGADIPDGDNFLQNLMTGGAGGRSTYANPEFDRLMTKQRETLDPRKRMVLLRDAQKLLQEKDCMLIPLYYDQVPVLFSSRVHAPEIGPGFSWRFSEWSL